MLVHDRAGLFMSIRGAIALTEVLEPTIGTNPCDTSPRIDRASRFATTNTSFPTSSSGT